MTIQGGEAAEDPAEAQSRHLRECMDDQKHAAHRSRREQADRRRAKKEEKDGRQFAEQARATWQLLGADTEQLWLLEEGHLREEAEKAGDCPPDLPLSMR